MIKANFKTYNNYITDSLHQWDLNQELTISGLNLSVAPEIHFANANMDRAIVRQSMIEAGVVKVMIPNSLLQKSLTIKAYIGIYEGSSFTVIEKVEITVIPRTRPYDYKISDSDEEIYSFDRLENELVNTRAYVDNRIQESLGTFEAVSDITAWITKHEIEAGELEEQIGDNKAEIEVLKTQLNELKIVVEGLTAAT